MMNKISIICVTRNDEYGAYQDLRTKVFFNGLNQIKNKQNYELILVDWNPPNDRLPFYEQYKDLFPKNIDTKIITVPSETHNNIVGSKLFKLFEYYGKNVGARHSSGNYLIFTNPDNFFFPELWSHIEDNICENIFMRLCRYDVRLPYVGNIDVDVIDGRSLIENPLHFYSTPSHNLTLPKDYLSLDKGFYWDINHEGASGDFLGVSKSNFQKVKGYVEHYTYGLFDGLILKDFVKLGLKQFILPTVSIHIDHSREGVVGRMSTQVSDAHVKDDSWGLLGNDKISVTEL